MTARGACAEHTRAPPALRRHGGVTPHSGHGDKCGRAQEQPFAGPAPAGTSAALTSLKPQPPTDELPDALSSKCNRITTRPSPAPPPVYKIPIRVCFRIKPRHSHTTPAYTCPTAQTLEQNRTKRVNFWTRTRRLGPRTGPRQERRAAGAPALGQLVGTPPDSGPLRRPGLVSGEPQALGLHSPRLQLCTGRPPRRATPKACPTQCLTPTPHSRAAPAGVGAPLTVGSGARSHATLPSTRSPTREALLERKPTRTSEEGGPGGNWRGSTPSQSRVS